VDFSGLNTKKVKDFKGSDPELTTCRKVLSQSREQLKAKDPLPKEWNESSTTFFSVLCYIEDKRPDIVILENVLNAPFKSARDLWFKLIDYSVEFEDCDTKDYYFPQTRTRKYLVAINNRLFSSAAGKESGDTTGKQVASLAASFLKSFKRRASVSVEKLLLSNTDKAVQLATQQMAHEVSGKKHRDISWAHSKTRHALVREANQLDDSHPFSGTKKTGETQFYDRTNMVLMNKQPPRVADVADINLLRGMKGRNAYDFRFKHKILDFSQNVDRNLGATPFGLSPCLTPSGASFITNQCRFVSGVEYFILQGLPHTMIHLSLETHENLKDLGGNAMTTTVVGATFLGAIMALRKHGIIDPAGKINKGVNRNQFEPITGSHDGLVGPFSAMPSSTFLDSSLVPVGFSTEDIKKATASEILYLTSQVRRYCYCHGVQMYSSEVLWRCKVCLTIRCESCKGNPPHDYERINNVPKAVGHEAAVLAIMTYFPCVVKAKFNRLATDLTKDFDQAVGERSKIAGKASSALKTAVFYYQQVRIAETISICYASASGFSLKVMIDTDSVTWYLYLDGHSDIGTALSATKCGIEQNPRANKGSALRDFCLRERPFARAKLTGMEADRVVPLEQDWTPWDFAQLYQPIHGSLIPDLFINVTRLPENHRQETLELGPMSPSHVSVSSKVHEILNTVYGTYKRRRQCDAAEESLYVLERHQGENLFLFKDPTRIGDPKLDTFVISNNPRLIQVHEHREILLSFGLRKENAENKMELHRLAVGTYQWPITMDGHWGGRTQFHSAQASPRMSSSLEKLSVAKELPKYMATSVCKEENRLIAEARFGIEGLPSHWILSKASWISEGKKWAYIPKSEQAELFKALAPIVPGMIWPMKRLETNVEIPQSSPCLDCSATLPPLHWVSKSLGSSLIPVHKLPDIATYEADLRKQLPSFEVHVQIPKFEQSKNFDTDVCASLRVGFNPSRIAHRALRLLPDV
jgi:site-specific DNA-cytosine methylase